MKDVCIDEQYIEIYHYQNPKPGKQYIPHVIFSYWDAWESKWEGGPHHSEKEAEKAMDEFIEAIGGEND